MTPIVQHRQRQYSLRLLLITITLLSPFLAAWCGAFGDAVQHTLRGAVLCGLFGGTLSALLVITVLVVGFAGEGAIYLLNRCFRRPRRRREPTLSVPDR